MKKTINAKLISLVLRYRRKNPHLGLRGISALLKEKHSLSVSKSTICNILQKLNLNSQRGRKQHVLLYRRRQVRGCGLILLRCLDTEIGLLENICNELRVYFPKIQNRLLEKMVLFLAFNSYLSRFAKNTSVYREFFKLADLYSFPARTYEYFLQKVITYTPTIKLEEARKNLQLVSTIKFYFGNGYQGYCDARLTTFWDEACSVDTFFSSIRATLHRLEYIEKHNSIHIYYTKSFDQFSPLAIDFLRSLTTGIKKIELLGPKGAVVFKKELSLAKPSFFIGYYPRIISRGFTFLEKGGNFKKLTYPGGEVLYSTMITRFIHPKTKAATITNNILLKNKRRMLPSWGILSDKKTNVAVHLRHYLLFWPFMERIFIEQMKTIESSYFTHTQARGLDTLIPEQLALLKEEDFAKIAEILAKIFGERFGDLDWKTFGEYTLGKESCSIVLKGVNSRIKEKFNNACLYLRDKRAFLL